ncbi:MAG: pirin family protein, partial [Gammaproteobacteria bacterium]|nr:pirin family protein [Gammaproteobacteria bacterium]
QWMTAGRGIEHSEMPEQDQGLLYGFQLWVNLPAAKKMTTPNYQELEPDQIPVEINTQGIEIRVIAGTTNQGTVGAVTNIEAAPLFFDVSIQAGETFQQHIPEGHNAFIYIIEGKLVIETTTVDSERLIVLTEGNSLQAKALDNSRIILVAGKPFNENVARYGPFVMNTEDELREAFHDYNKGLFGKI